MSTQDKNPTTAATTTENTTSNTPKPAAGQDTTIPKPSTTEGQPADRNSNKESKDTPVPDAARTTATDTTEPNTSGK